MVNIDRTSWVAAQNKELVDRAEKGDSNAIYKLAIAYQNDVFSDKKIAVELYESAAKLGNAEAIASLGMIYFEGKIVQQDVEKGEALCRKASALGQSYTIAWLSVWYAEGDVVPQDLKKSEVLGQEAAGLGIYWALHELAEI